MFPQSIAPVWSQALLAAMLAAIQTRPAAALTAALKVHLYTAGPSPILPTSTPSSFTEATFTGYAAVTLGTLSGPIITPGATCEGLFANASFIGTTGLTPQTILGYWIDDGSTNFVLGEAFPTPIQIVHPGDFIDLAAILGAAFNPVY